MNKKNKSNKRKVETTCSTEEQESVQKHENISDFNKVKKTKNEKSSQHHESELNLSISEDLPKNYNKNKKKKKNIEGMDIIVPDKKTKPDCDSGNSSLLGENIKVSVNNIEQPVSDKQDEIMKNNKRQNKKLKCLNAEESQIKDEDIDQFCEDLDDQSNTQYENWIKLIEAKLHSKKKSE